MDDFVKTTLESWGLLDRLRVSFDVNEVDKQTLLNLDREDLKELIPILSTRKLFGQKLEKLKIEHQIPSPLDCTRSVSEASTSSSLDLSIWGEAPSFDNSLPLTEDSQKNALGVVPYTPHTSYINSVRQLLDSTPEGNVIIASYGSNKQFLRSKLCELIIKNELKNNFSQRISSARFVQLAKEINDVFIHEEHELYYVPYARNFHGKPKAARGKLWSTYTYLRKNYKKLGLLPSGRNTSTDILEYDDIDEPDEIEWLKHNTNDFAKVTEKWRATTNYRINHFPETIVKYFSTYPCLKHKFGYTLLQIDFNNLFKDKEDLLINEWPSLHSHILEIAKTKKDGYLNKIITDYNEKGTQYEEVFALVILPLLFSCVNLKRKSGSNHWRPSKVEIQNGFILHVKDITDLETQLSLREQKYRNYNLTAQPIPVIVGELSEIHSCYVCVNNIRYNVETPLSAVDLCFKIYHVLNATYPTEADSVWMFLQLYVYKLKTTHDRQYVSVNSLIADLNKIVSKN